MKNISEKKAKSQVERFKVKISFEIYRKTFCKCITCHEKGISLATFMHRSHKSTVTKGEWHFLFVLGFQNEVIFRKPIAKMQSSLGSQ